MPASLEWRFALREKLPSTEMVARWRVTDRFALEPHQELWLFRFPTLPVALEELRRQLNRLTVLEHPNLLPLIDYRWLSSEQLLWLIFPDPPSLTLTHHLARLGRQERLHLALTLAATVADLHGAQIIHGNLSSPLISVSQPTGQLKCSCPGLRGLLPPVQETLAFLAPELVLGQTASQATDLYALGMVSHEILTGKLPFASLDSRAVLQSHLHGLTPGPLADPSGEPYSDLWSQLVFAMLQKNPAARPAAQQILERLPELAPTRHPIVLPAVSRPKDSEQLAEKLKSPRQLGVVFKGQAIPLRTWARTTDRHYLEWPALGLQGLSLPPEPFLLVLPDFQPPGLGLYGLAGILDCLAAEKGRGRAVIGMHPSVLALAPEVLIPMQNAGIPTISPADGAALEDFLRADLEELILTQFDAALQTVRENGKLSDPETLLAQALTFRRQLRSPTPKSLAGGEETLDRLGLWLASSDSGQPLRAWMHLYAGYLADALGDRNRALEEFNQALQHADPSTSCIGLRAALARATIFIALQEEARARVILEDVVERSGKAFFPFERAAAAQLLGELNIAQGLADAAIQAWETALTAASYCPPSPSRSKTCTLLTEALRGLGRFAAALRHAAQTDDPQQKAHLYLDLLLPARALLQLDQSPDVVGLRNHAQHHQQAIEQPVAWIALLEELQTLLHHPDDQRLLSRWLKAQRDQNPHLQGRIAREAAKTHRRALALKLLIPTILRLLQESRKDEAVELSRLLRDEWAEALAGVPEEISMEILHRADLLRALAAASLPASSALARPPRKALPVSLEKIWELSHAMNRQSSPIDVLSALLTHSMEIVGADRGALWTSGEFPLAQPLARGFVGDSAAELNAGMEIGRRVMTSGEAVLSLDALNPLPAVVADAKVTPHLHSILCHPLSFSLRTVGVLYLDHPASKGVFTAEHQMIVSLLCEQASVALKNASLLSEIAGNTQSLLQAAERIEELNRQMETRLATEAERLRETRETLDHNALRTGPRAVERRGLILGISRRMMQIGELLDKIAHSEAPVLIQGESGTGKERLARIIQAESPVSQGPFVTFNCGALAPDLLEGELFGHVRGAFTGAEMDRAGLFEQADQGTLFLDEVGEMPMAMQAKLLRVLQEGEVRRIGDSQTRPVRVRILSASHRDLKAMVRAETFREDLLYRLNVIPMTLPPLRERKEDLLPLAQEFLRTFRGERPSPLMLHPHVILAFEAYSWPGNVRELGNLLESLSAVHEPSQVLLADLPTEIQQAFRDARAHTESAENEPHGEGFQDAVSRFEKAYLKAALARHSQNVSQAARASNMHRSTFRRLLAVHGLKND